MRGRATLLLIALSLAVSTLAGVSSAFAHPTAQPPVDFTTTLAEDAGPAGEWRASGSGVGTDSLGAWIAFIIATVLALRRLRNALAIATVLAAIVLVFESGVHSVHHLGDDHAASQCVVASASTHLAGTPAEPPSFEALRVLSIDRPPIAVVVTVRQSSRPDASRAPPA
jgi:hypothetical protein